MKKKITLEPISPHTDSDFLSDWSVSTPSQTKKIFRLTIASSQQLWDSVVGESGLTNDHWLFQRILSGPSYYHYQFKTKEKLPNGKPTFEPIWAKDCTSFFKQQLQLDAGDIVFWMVWKDLTYVTIWEVFQSCFFDFRTGGAQPAFLLCNTSSRYGGVDGGYDTWAGDRPKRCFDWLELENLKESIGC